MKEISVVLVLSLALKHCSTEKLPNGRPILFRYSFSDEPSKFRSPNHARHRATSVKVILPLSAVLLARRRKEPFQSCQRRSDPLS